MRGEGRHERPVAYARDDDASHHGRTFHLRRPARGEGRAEDVCGRPKAPPAAKQARSLQVERRIDVGPDGGEATRGRFRESHESPGTRPGARLSRRHLGDGDPVPVWRDDVLEQGGAARGQPLRDRRRRKRAAPRDRPAHALGRRAGLQHHRRVSDRADLAIRGAIVISDGAYPRDVLIREGRISALVEAGAASAAREIDARGLLALPGIVDAHVHFNEPGRTDWEGWATGSRAAVAGGITTVLDMPLNSLPPILDGDAFDAKRAAAERSSLVDFGLWGGLVDADPMSLIELRDRGAIGCKAFLCDSGVPEFPPLGDDELVPALRAAAEAGLLVALHAEDETLVREATGRVRGDGRRDAAAWAASRPPLVEVRAVARACAAAREAGARIHIVHLQAVEALGAIGAARDSGTDVTVETCPHYLEFDDSDMEHMGPALKCAPPIRDMRNRDGLWQALVDGKIDLVASDHSPCTPDLKARGTRDIFAAWGGVAGVQSLLPVTFTEAARRAADALDVRKVAGFIAWRLAAKPARRLGSWPRKGTIAAGSDADVVLFDPDREWTLDRERSYTRGVDPYIGRSFRGRIVSTLVAGRTVYNDRETVTNPARGRFIGRGEVAERMSATTTRELGE